MPLWAAFAIAGAAYLARGLIIRGGDFSPDLPEDAIVLVALIVGVGLVGVARAQYARDGHEEAPTGQDDDKRTEARRER